MAFANRPKVIVCDEPTTGLDVTTQSRVLETIRDLCRSHRVAALYVTHDLAVVAELADRVAVMYAGRIVESGPRERIFTAPRHPYTRKLLAAFPNIHADRRTLDVIPGQPPDLVTPPPGCRFAPRCPFVMPVCTEVVPPEVRFEDGVRVACHLFPPTEPGATAVETPATSGPTRAPVAAATSPTSAAPA
jgi:peptide/nickel transport system ATP-binding protein